MRIGRKAGTGVAILGSLLLAVSGAVPALARSSPSAGLNQFTGLRFANAGNKTNTGFAGWVFTPKAAKSVTAEFKVPKLKCTSAASGVGPIAAMLTGTAKKPLFNAAGLIMECSGGSPAAAAAAEVDGAATVGKKAVHIGDLIKSTITTSASKTTATVADVTKGHTFTVTKSGKGAAALAEEVIDDSLVNSSGKQLPVANFGTISFSSGAVSGKALGSVSPRTAFNMQTSKKVLQIVTGPITGAKKNAFTTTFKHS